MKEYKEALITQIEHKKKSAIENIEKENMIPAMWDVTELIDLKAQLGILNKIIKNQEDK